MKKLILICCLFLLPFTKAMCQEADTIRNTFRINATLESDGILRTYLLVLPPGYYTDSSSFPLVIGLHGFGGSAVQFERDYGFSTKAKAAGFIAVYPEGVPNNGPLHLRSWNAGECCNYAMQHQINDVAFINTLITALTGRYRINIRRIYITGMSNGAMMAYRLACELSGKIAAIAPVSGTQFTAGVCHPATSVPVLHIHSAADTKVPYRGGRALAGYYYPPVDSALLIWRLNNSCSATPLQRRGPNYTYTQWTNPKTNAMVALYLTTDGGHSWPGGKKSTPVADAPSTAINATDVIWEFFKQY